ncbi:hypothetical protein FRC0316_00036 [Corynebacterium diphtheriae]|nr:hypothetical protein CIP101352_00134 [Corynebacterium diphtheriae]CAB0531547.1 hypothetical protein CIP107524_00042 [Corynebacterium diphtheriae]CAB0624887.1 hypothetical protein FRC0016_00013 [Corynebacterium diphtheriae]CAB0672287.1 hypothetical protein FRC0032_00018 [Corynebacterium diphtheriae]CAB0675220.1 hypothetical protein FRC0049_00172 [Corynebacterium diphtheriae]
MKEKKLSSLVFGNVILESQILGTTIRIYADDMRSYSFRPSPYASLSVPLNELKGQLQPDHAEALAKKVFDSVAEELNKNYPGGCERAEKELKAWLLRTN